MNTRMLCFSFLLCCLALSACSQAPAVAPVIQQEPLRFDGDRAYTLEEAFVTTFPNRDSGTENNTLAAAWIKARYEELGWTCRIDSWDVVDHSRRIPLQDVICELPGDSPRQILVTAHHDQAPMTVQGADNDGSGEVIMLHLAEIFAAEGTPKYTLTFISTDGEEYGTLGARRYVQSLADPGNVIASLTLDNLGKVWYTSMKLESQGLYRSYGALWLKRLIARVVQERGGMVNVATDDVVGQILNQAVPIGAMDHAPMVAAGIPAVGFTRICPPEHATDCFDTYHTPDDLIDFQSPQVLEGSGRIAEASLRQLLSMDSFPEESGPYLYFAESQRVLRGAPLWLAFAAFVAIFFVGGVAVGEPPRVRGWMRALPHFLGIWLPILAAFLLPRLFVVLGLMDRFEIWPGMAKDAVWYNPRWPAIGLFVLGLVTFLIVGRRMARGYPRPEAAQTRSLGLLAIGLACTYVFFRNPFSLFLAVPALAWFLIRDRRGLGRVVDIALLLIGALVIFAALYFLGFVVWPLKFYVFWYLMMMFSIPNMIGIPTTLVVTAILAAGVSMVVRPARA